MSETRKSVLVAEDNFVLSDVMRINLDRAGFAVTVARTGGKAVECLRAATFDLLICDFNMPELDGEGVIRAARTEIGLCDLPIIMCSAKGLELDSARLCAEWNVAQVLHKPFSMREIIGLASRLTAAL